MRLTEEETKQGKNVWGFEVLRNEIAFRSAAVVRKQTNPHNGSETHVGQLDRMMPVQQSVHVIGRIRADENSSDSQDQYNREPDCDNPHHVSEI